MRNTGTYETLGDLRYFIPDRLPPCNPPLQLSQEIIELYTDTIFNLGKLNEMSHSISDQKRFINSYVIKEAVLSCAIEGIHTTLVDIFTYSHDESIQVASKDTQLVVNYIAALEKAMTLIKDENLPICSRVILAAHETLLSRGQGTVAAQ